MFEALGIYSKCEERSCSVSWHCPGGKAVECPFRTGALREQEGEAASHLERSLKSLVFCDASQFHFRADVHPQHGLEASQDLVG